MISPHRHSPQDENGASALPESPLPENDQSIDVLVHLAKLLGDETRVRILTMLSEQHELCVRELWERLAQTQPGVSHHLALLRAGGLVRTHQVGRNIYYRLDPDGLAALVEACADSPLGRQILRAFRL